MFRLTTLIAACLCFLLSQAQIRSYPYTEDFEDFTLVQNTGSCLTPGGATANGWSQLTTDDGDWRSDTAGTPSISTGPGATSTTNGVGVGTDVNPGNIGGHYLYTEATGCGNTEVILLSPQFDFSGQDSFFQLKFHFHMFGDGIGSLHIDILDDTSWHDDQWVQIGQVDSNWHQATLNLAGFNSDSVRIRIRGITGSNFRSDICIDNIIVQDYTPPRYDAVMWEMTHSQVDYPISPLSHLDSVRVWAKVKNEGVLQITGTKVNISEGSYSSDVQIGTINSFDTSSAWVQKAYTATSTGEKILQAVVSINEADSFAMNDSMQTSFIVSDSVLARENSSSIAGVGFNNASGFLGQMFEVKVDDTLTSISFYCQGASGDSVRVLLYAFDSLPGTLIETSEYAILSGARNWYTLALDCEQILSPGKYLATVEQKGLNNLGLSMEASGYIPNTVFFRVATTTVWTPIENAGFEVCYLLRMNFGKVQLADVSISLSKDTVCQGANIVAQGSGAFSYQWEPSQYFANSKAAISFVSLPTSQEIRLIGSSRCGFTDTASTFITIEKGPTFQLSPDTTVCRGEQAHLRVETNNPYQWLNGPNSTDYYPTIQSDSIFQLEIDSNNGCSRTAQINVSMSFTDLTVSGDTTICQNSPVTLIASGASSYQWVNGPMDSIYNLLALTTGYYRVSGSNALGCESTDSVFLNVLDAPELNLPADTGACFTDSLYLIAQGADSMYWEGYGPDSVLALRVVKVEDYVVVAKNKNGCSVRDTVHVEVYIPPLADVSNDTSICEGKSTVLNASGGDLYMWSTQENSSSIVVSPTSSTTYYVDVISLNGCVDEDSIRPFTYCRF